MRSPPPSRHRPTATHHTLIGLRPPDPPSLRSATTRTRDKDTQLRIVSRPPQSSCGVRPLEMSRGLGVDFRLDYGGILLNLNSFTLYPYDAKLLTPLVSVLRQESLKPLPRGGFKKTYSFQIQNGTSLERVVIF